MWDPETVELLWEVSLDEQPYAMAVSEAGIAVLAGDSSILVYPSD